MKIRPNLESNAVKFRNLEEMTLTKLEKKVLIFNILKY